MHAEIATHLTARELELVEALASRLDRGATVVEIGSYLGASTNRLASGASRIEGHVHAVDTWQNMGMTEGPRDTFAQFKDNVRPYRDHITTLRGLSVDIASRFEVPIDMVFIDGDHTYEGVLSDLKSWLPHMRRRAMIVMHDYSWAEGVQQAIREMILPIAVEGVETIDNTLFVHVDATLRAPQRDPFVSVIVPTIGLSHVQHEVIDALLKQPDLGTRGELIVVDNSRDGSVVSLLGPLEDTSRGALRVVHEPIPGLVAGRHRGVLLAKGDVLSFVDDDAIVGKQWLDGVYEAFCDPSVSLVTGPSMGRFECTPPRYLHEFWREIDGGRCCGHLSLCDLGPRDRIISSDYVWGLNFSIRRQTLRALGGFHPDAYPWSLSRYRGDGETAVTNLASSLGLGAHYRTDLAVEHAIPAKRLEIPSLIRRSFLQGISDSFSQFRKDGTSLSTLRLLRQSLSTGRSRVRDWARAVARGKTVSITTRSARAHDAGALFHRLSMLNDARLVTWVTKKDFWDYRMDAVGVESTLASVVPSRR